MTDRVAEIAAGLSEHDRQNICDAAPSDCAEWWVYEPLEDKRLDIGDGVLTPLGEAVRAHLQSKSDVR